LKYGTFSVVMCRSRSLAYFSAANLDRSTRGTSERGSWRNDPRIAPREQIGESFYGDQRAHDDQATDFPFDRGHLTRFADARWGDLERRNGADSFHFPNCVPQHEAFNQSDSRNGIWWRLEDWAVDLGASGRLCIINGPLFDAPASKKQKGERVLQPHRPAHRDPVFNGVAVPKQFFKVIAFVGSDDKLALQAFVVTQENVLETTEAIREALTDRELSLYRVKMKVVEKLSGLSFGRLSSGGITINEADVSDVELITSLDQL
ncbi:MAG TPA: DNA/RNA non-specific endonuclease, partial [Acidimicrobiales bacterium]|nr:DNA/RNA non-specific endonuclease [Acidimicrobiales bacterium]